MTITDSDRLIAAGRTITLADGRAVNVRFGFRGLKKLEDTFGSLAKVSELVEVDENGQPVGAVFGPLGAVIAAGLTHEHLDEDELDSLLDPTKLSDYMVAVSAALGEALPAPKDTPKARRAKKETNGSLGGSSTSSPPSGSDEPTSSSGE